MERRWIRSIAILIGFVLLLGACGGQSSNQVGPYADQGYEMGNSNPNLQTSPTHYNYRNVMKLARSVLSEIDGIKSSNIYVDGAKMRVRLQLDEGLSKEQKDRIKKEAAEMLDYSFPVFDVNVNIADDR